ncbi:pectate lyase-like adhesive domain-containing protein [uncultured Methanobrevibacter sp.]|uniref:pectate lyase-like adhesive domain-containing protein n=1 Tax=uncultured Methanobrevibacter sp. TaxID=253161 RepID=UPI0025CFB685|nr:pectate lyase-like adhesive domain-containing protein [uncultured Methanobrevibacter sp.]
MTESETDKTTADNAELTFTDLNTAIKGSTNSTIYLSNNYKYNNDTDFMVQGGISINRNLVIYGNGVTIDGNKMARIFFVSSSANVKFYNINFINAEYSSAGAALIHANAYNCTFNNNKATNGQAMYNGNAALCRFNGNNNYQTTIILLP